MQWMSRAAVALALVTQLGCYAGVAYDTDYPSGTYVSAAPPVYYEGRPVYWYRNHWYYREGRGWRHYPNEPVVLYQRRVARRPPPPGWRASPPPPPTYWHR
jgi:hypothetical protein